MVFIGLGDKDWAFQRVTKFVEERGVDLPYLKVNPFFDPFAPDPRFAEFAWPHQSCSMSPFTLTGRRITGGELDHRLPGRYRATLAVEGPGR